MKILLVSLLRSGDLVMITPIVRRLKELETTTSVDLLTTDSNSHLKSLLPDIDTWISFDRSAIQSSLGQAENALTEGYFRIKELIEKIDARNYDQVINLTHTTLSAHLVGAFACKDKRGANFGTDGKIHFNSMWFRYLNEVADSTSHLHFMDILYRGCGFEDYPTKPFLNESSDGVKKAAQLTSGKLEKYVLLQMTSSEEKKTWSIKQVEDFIYRFSQQTDLLGYDLILPCSTQENEKFQSWFDQLRFKLKTSRVHLIPCDVETLYSLIVNAQLVVTPDTLTKHLAAAAGTKSIELSLGSSYFAKTGIYLNGSYILQPRTKCLPCPHGGSCQQTSHICGLELRPEVVVQTAVNILLKRESKMTELAIQVGAEIQFFRVSIAKDAGWAAFPLLPFKTSDQMLNSLDQICEKLVLSHSPDALVSPLGTLSREFQIFFNQLDWAPEEKSNFLKRCRSQFLEVEKNIQQLSTKFGNSLSTSIAKQSLGRWNSLVDDAMALLIEKNVNPILVEDLATFKPGSTAFSFAGVKRISDRILRTEKKNEFRIKVLRSLENTLEVGL